MASRYWVGGAGSWSSTTKWSTTSGGASGASVPTSADDVIFDANSGGKFVAQIDVVAVCNSFSYTPAATVGFTTIQLNATAAVSLTMGNFTTTGTNADNRLLFIGGASILAPSTALLTVNGTVSISDVDFQGIRVTGTAAPISGTRIGNRQQNNSGITFSTPKTVYWNLAGTNNWSATGWAASSGGAPNRDNFPLAQDTAVIDNTGAVTQINLSTAFDYLPSINMTRTTAFTFNVAALTYFFGSALTLSSGVTISGTSTVYFCYNGTMTVTSAGKTCTFPIIVTRGTFLLNGAYTSSNTMQVAIGTFDTAGYACTFTSFTFSGIYYKKTYFRSSTVTLNGGGVALSVLRGSSGGVFDAGTSTITITGASGTISTNGYVTLYNVTFVPSQLASSFQISPVVTLEGRLTIAGTLTLNGFSSANNNYISYSVNNPFTVGTLALVAPSISNRVRLVSTTIGTQRTITCGAISAASHFDFRDIALAGAAAPVTYSQYVGDLGNNSGITFPAGRNLYWNLAGSNNWNANGWALTSGGTPSATVFPLAQDTAIVDNNSAGTSLNLTGPGVYAIIGTLTFANRTTAFTFATTSTDATFYGDLILSSAITLTSTTADVIRFSKVGTQTLTTAGLTPSWAITVTGLGGYTAGSTTFSPLATTLVLGSAYTSGATVAFNVTSANFDAATYNFTVSSFSATNATAYVRMGSGTWTLTGTGTVLNFNVGRNIWCGTADVLLSNNTTTARAVTLGMAAINKLTIGGNTSTSTTTITAGTLNTSKIKELASTKTVAHTVTLDNAAAGGHIVGRISLAGTAGNVVTFNGSSASATIAIYGTPVAVDYLSVSNFNFSSSMTPFYAGANSTLGAGNTNVVAAAVPTPRALYWVGGTGNWSATTSWSTSSGGASGAAIPTVMDSVTFNSASGSGDYTATIDALSYCAAFNASGPSGGTLTLASSNTLIVHGNMTYAATGVTNSVGNDTYLAGAGSYTLNPNGVRIGNLYVAGMYSTWTLGSAMSNSDLVSYFYLRAGTFNMAGYAGKRFNWAATVSPYFAPRTFDFSGSTLQCDQDWLMNESTTTAAPNLTVTATSSTINSTANGNITRQFQGNGDTYNIVNKTNNTGLNFSGANTLGTFNISYVDAGFPFTFSHNCTIGTLISNGTTTTARHSFVSSVIGTPVTLTVASATLQNVDFRDVTFTGAAAPYNGTSLYLGDMGGNTGITFPAPKTVYWNLAGAQGWTANGWASTSGGTPALTNFPLVQDTGVIDNNSAGTSITFNSSAQIAKIDASTRTTAFTWLLSGGYGITSYGGGFLLGPGISISGTSTTYGWAGTRTVTILDNSATGGIFAGGTTTFNKPNGTVSLQSAVTFSALALTAGTLNTNNYTVTLTNLSGGGATTFINAGSSLFTVTGTAWNLAARTTYTGAGSRASFTSASAKTFTVALNTYSGLTVDQAGSGQLILAGSGTFAGLSNSYAATGATSISVTSATGYALTNGWNAVGSAGKLLTLNSTSTTQGVINYSGSGTPGRLDYSTFSGYLAFLPDSNAWYAGANSTQTWSVFGVFFSTAAATYYVYVAEAGAGTDTVSGSTSPAGNVYNVYIVEVGTGTDTDSARFTARSTVTETATGTDSASARFTARSTVTETATVTDTDSAARSVNSAIGEAATGSDSVSSKVTFIGSVTELASVTDLVSAVKAFVASITETATGTDTTSAKFTARSSVSETATIADVTLARKTMPSSISETATISDADLARMLFPSSVTETATGTDVDIGGLAFRSSVSETATGTDTDAARYIARPSISETATGTDTDSARLSARSVIAETATIADVDLARLTFPSAVAETGSVADSIVGGLAFRSAISETATGTDTDAARYIARPSISETATGTDTDSARLSARGAISETANIVDVTLARMTLPGSVAETANIVDVTLARMTLPGTVSETATITDVDTARYIARPTVSESATVTDTDSARARFGSAVTESATGTDTDRGTLRMPVSVTETATGTQTDVGFISFPTRIAETANITDVDSAGLAARSTITETATATDVDRGTISLSSRVAETATGTDTETARYIARPAVVESATVSDTDSAKLRANAQIVEGATIADVINAYARFVARITETGSGIDTVSAIRVVNALISELTTASDTMRAAALFANRIQEGASIADAVSTVGSKFGARLNESAQITGVPIPTARINASVVDSASISDAALAAYLWNLINDSQNANWQNIADAQTPGWQTIDAAQSASWNITNTTN